MIMRIREPRTTALVFSSGKMVCTGAKRQVHLIPLLSLTPHLPPHSEELSRLAARKYARIIQKLGFPVNTSLQLESSVLVAVTFNMQARFMEFKIQNMVGSCDVKFPIRLEGLVINQPQFSRLASWPHTCTQSYTLFLTPATSQSCSQDSSTGW